MLHRPPEADGHANITNQLSGKREEVLNILGNAGFIVAGISALGYMGQVMHIIPITGSTFLWTGGLGLFAGAILKK